MSEITSTKGIGGPQWPPEKQPSEGKAPYHVVGQTAYLDVSALSGYSAEAINRIIADLKACGITQIDLAFANLSNESSWEAGGSATFSQVVNAAHASGMKVDLSFGGALQGPDAWHLGSPSAAKQKAADVAAFAKAHGIDGLDFDYEVTYKTGDEPNLLIFFQTLHSEENVPPMTLTVMASTSNSVGSFPGFSDGCINILFQNFSSCFDELNLMMYGGPEYLDGAHDPNPYLQYWIGKKDGSFEGVAQKYGIPLSHIHVGFMDYANERSGGYAGSGTDGANAAAAYKKVLENLGYQPSDLGTTFWWPNEGYNTDPSKGYEGIIETLQKEIGEYNNG